MNELVQAAGRILRISGEGALVMQTLPSPKRAFLGWRISPMRSCDRD